MPPKRKTAAANTQNGTKRQKAITSNATTVNTAKRTRKSTAATKTSGSTKFTVNNCEKWFKNYADVDDPFGNITPEGAQRFFEDIGISLESVDPLLIGWKMNASRMGYFTKEEWMNAMTKLQVESTEAFKQQIPTWKNELQDETTFKRFYQYVFDFVKTAGQKSMDVDTAVAVWPLLLDNMQNHISSFIQFIQDTKPVRVINKDQWSSLLDFTRTVPNDLAGYDITSSWPVLFDDYVNWQLKRSEH